jgi:hypothetical protein
MEMVMEAMGESYGSSEFADCVCDIVSSRTSAWKDVYELDRHYVGVVVYPESALYPPSMYMCMVRVWMSSGGMGAESLDCARE